ncbi:putative methylesterase 14, chloroplastic [Selaginella moellendorffii]|uniref:putative methylesterase 14, chloroplastic n=1 Tax=Selaginella moellendorffii TaxID=88036 RepID=UPI000D1D037C|nr:putative methylesterase 14, chloroplastic [Selaginella moellendorffii]|eukprot:XP_002973861.2 putative methylesterase 14, chloroplastic [Selaginella moellendorffii]
MGNGLARMVSGKGKKNSSSSSSAKKDKAARKAAQKKQKALEEELIERQVLAFALQQQQKSIRLERAASQRNNPNLFPEKLPRSASTRPRSISDPVVPPHQLVNGIKPGLPDNLESKHFVLVHGAGNGAWCWYKSIALLEESGFTASTVDLTGSGIDHTDPNTISTLSQYVKPLLSLLEKLPDNEKVILVGHDFGGACISYAMEAFPTKICKAVFVSAAMVANGQRASDIFAPELITADDLLPKAQQFVYANGSSSVPTALEFDKSLIKDLFFNQSPAKDVALATVSLRPVPFAPTLERLCLTQERYGSVRRFFIQTTDDCALTPALQERLISSNPPEKVFLLKGSDHSPFFSKPQSLHKLLLEIAQIEPLKPSSPSLPPPPPSLQDTEEQQQR